MEYKITEEIFIQIENYRFQKGERPNAVFLNSNDWEKLKSEAQHQLQIEVDYSKKIFGVNIYVSQDFKDIRVGEVFF